MAAAFLRAAKKPPTTSFVARASSDRKRCYVTSPCSGSSEIKESFDSQISIHSNRTLKPSVRDSSSREMASTICERLQVPRLSLARFDRAVARSMFRWKTCSSIKKVSASASGSNKQPDSDLEGEKSSLLRFERWLPSPIIEEDFIVDDYDFLEQTADYIDFEGMYYQVVRDTPACKARIGEESSRNAIEKKFEGRVIISFYHNQATQQIEVNALELLAREIPGFPALLQQGRTSSERFGYYVLKSPVSANCNKSQLISTAMSNLQGKKGYTNEKVGVDDLDMLCMALKYFRFSWQKK